MRARKLYPAIGASPRSMCCNGASLRGGFGIVAHLEHDKTVLNWQGAQIPLICFDELTHFSASSSIHVSLTAL